MLARSHVDFVIIGAMRARTTSLYYELAQHPLISMSRTKETDYFLPHVFAKTKPQHYIAQFDPTKPLWGEASPNYTKCDIFDGVASRLATHSPSAKLIFIARDPVERVISQYHHALYLGRPVPSPDELIASSSGAHMINTSRYFWQLSKFRDHFPREALLVVDIETLSEPNNRGLNTILSFIGAPAMDRGIEAQNQNSSVAIEGTPKFVRTLRRNPICRSLYSTLPHDIQQKLKLVRFGKPKPNTVGFSDQQKKEIWHLLQSDIEDFAREYAFSTTRWSKKYEC